VRPWSLPARPNTDGVTHREILRAVASADRHNLVFQRDYRIIAAISNGRTP
jgi:hypothetical protein